ncbi:MAG: type VI secretion system tip protein TssI/VgrG [Endozoicomonas sp. (ex Botrylloides leachii)]|nr:type VI secretion system tip protein TssI/VgrG [Endozoicomonas sp. (ex Botrylloides leachii)]
MGIPTNPENHSLIVHVETGDVWIVTNFTSTEGIDQLFEHKAIIISKRLDQKLMLGKKMAFEYRLDLDKSNSKSRFFHGFCISIKLKGKATDKSYFFYEVCAAPWCWFLTLNTNCCVFQNKKTTEIISTLSRNHGFNSNINIIASGDSQREYCVQFNESDWDFIQRLIQNKGWFFYFTQEKNNHKLIIIDSNQHIKSCGAEDVHFDGRNNFLAGKISQWAHGYHAQVGSIVSGDYNYELAKPIFSDKAQTQYAHEQSKHIEKLIYPGGFDSHNQGEKTSSKIMQGIDTKFSQVQGASNVLNFTSGTTFKLTHHPIHSEQGTWLLSELKHEIMPVGNSYSYMPYKNEFLCSPIKPPWKPHKLIPKPVISGVQSAQVTGTDNEEIYQDKHHRIKLKFHWDRQGKNDQSSSCWVRVAQSMAGDGFGCQFTPRVGDEVLVCFLDGDPDRPLVIGSVYNGKHRQPYKNSMEQGIKLKSLPGAGAENYSEMRFNCKKGQELLALQAEKDMSVLVKNNADSKVVGNNIVAVEKSSDRTIKENDTHKVQGMLTAEVTKDISIKTDSNCQLQVKGNIQQHADGDYHLKTKKNQMLEAVSISAKGSKGIELTVGSTTIELSSSTAKISCGASSIELSASGISISGTQIKLEGTTVKIKGNASTALEAGGQLTAKGTMVSVTGTATAKLSASGLAQLSGGIVKIN